MSSKANCLTLVILRSRESTPQCGRFLHSRTRRYSSILRSQNEGMLEVAECNPPRLDALDGRVTVLLPGKPCLSCRGVTNAARAAEEALRRESPDVYEKRKAEAYVFGEGNPSPVVVTFTTEL